MAPAGTATAADVVTRYPELEVSSIESSGLNPRTHWNDADDRELEESIRAEGVLEPIIVRPHPAKGNVYQIVAGERRFRAAGKVGLGQVPAIIRNVTDEKLIELALTENIQRRNMHPLDEANGFITRLEMGGCSPEALASSLGMSKRYVTDRIRLKNLSKLATEGLESGRISLSHALLLSKLDPKQQDEAIRDCESYEFDFEAGDAGKRRVPAMQPVSALKDWIDQRRPALDPKSPDAQDDFPELVREATEAEAAGATIVALSEFYSNKPKAGDPLSRYRWEECKKKDKGATRGFIADGHRRGTMVYFKPKEEAKPGSTRTASHGETDAEKKRRLAANKREQAAVEKRKQEAVRTEQVRQACALAAMLKVKSLDAKSILILLIEEDLANAGTFNDAQRQELAAALNVSPKAFSYPPGKLLDDLTPRQLMGVAAAHLVCLGYGKDQLKRSCAALGIDYAAIDKRIAAEQQAALKKASPAKAAKKAKKR